MHLRTLLSLLLRRRRVSSINAQRIALLLVRPELLFRVNPYYIIIGNMIHDHLYPNKERDYYAIVDGVRVYGRSDGIINDGKGIMVEELKTYYDKDDRDRSLAMGIIQANIYCYILNANSIYAGRYRVRLVDCSILLQYRDMLLNNRRSNAFMDFMDKIDKYTYIHEGDYDSTKALHDIKEGIRRLEGIYSILDIDKHVLRGR